MINEKNFNCIYIIMSSLPKISKFTPKKNLACREYPYIITPNPGDQTYASGNDILFRISAGDDKSRLRCIYGPATYGSYIITVTNSSGGAATCRLDGNSNCVFSRITTNGPGGVLEEFNKPNTYIPCVFDLNESPDSRINYWSAFGNHYLGQPEEATYALTPYTLSGTAAAVAITAGNVLSIPATDPPTRAIYTDSILAIANDIQTEIAALVNTSVPYGRFVNSNVRNGYKFNNGATFLLAAPKSVALAFMLPSILGSFSKRLFPISELSQSSLDVTLLCETDTKALITSAAGFTYELSKVRLNLSIVEYNDVITNVIREAYKQSYTIPCNSIQHFSQSITATTASTFSLSFNATLQNAKGILFTFNDNDNNTQLYPSLTGRTSLGINQAQLTIGPYSIPSNRFMTYDSSTAIASLEPNPNFFLSAMKYFGNHIDTNMICSTNIREFNTCGALANGTFVLAFSLEGIHEMDDEFRSTTPLDGYTTFLNFTTGVNAASTTTVNCFILYEFDVIIQAGTAMAINKLTSMNGSQMYK